MENTEFNYTHGLIATIPDQNNPDKVNIIQFIGLSEEPDEDYINFWRNELQTDPELGCFYQNEKGESVCLDFSFTVAKPHVVELFKTLNLKDDGTQQSIGTT